MEIVGFERIPITRIEVPQRLRSVDEDWVGALAVSIGETGLQQPIQLAKPAKRNGRYRLLAGAHRLAACQRVGHTEILARVLQVGALEARLIEIDENLIRRELNPLDRAAFLFERKAIYEELHPNTRAGVAGGKARQGSATDMMSFAESAAEKIGLSPRSIERAVRIHSRLSAEVRGRIVGTRLAEKQSELLALARLDPERQAKVLDLVLAAESPARSVGAALKVMNGTPVLPDTDRQLQRLLDAWNRSGGKARAAFLKQLHEVGVLDRPADGGRYCIKEAAA